MTKHTSLRRSKYRTLPAPSCPDVVWVFIPDHAMYRPFQTDGAWKKELWRYDDKLPVFESRMKLDEYARKSHRVVVRLEDGAFFLQARGQ